MRYDSVRGLKAELRAMLSQKYDRPPISLGISPTSQPGDYLLAVRIRQHHPSTERLLAAIAQRAVGETDIRLLRVKLPLCAGASPVEAQRVLTIGSSVAHYRCSAGTLGFFARRLSDNAAGFVSCNHVIAATDHGKSGDQVLSPGPADQRGRSGNVVGLLDGNYPDFFRTRQIVDCAFAELLPAVEYDPARTAPRESLSSRIAMPREAALVEKIGRTTGRTVGRVTAYDVDDVDVQYPFGYAVFDNQIEIETYDHVPFSRPGDSGSLVMTREREPVGLLHASSSDGLSYANPIGQVLEALGVDILSG
jgi:hypothetical protein